MPDILVYFFIVCVVVWAVIKAFKAIDSDGAIWEAARKAITTKLMGWFQQPVGGPGHGPEQEQRAATKIFDDRRAHAKELSEAENRGREQGKE